MPDDDESSETRAKLAGIWSFGAAFIASAAIVVVMQFYPVDGFLMLLSALVATSLVVLLALPLQLLSFWLQGRTNAPAWLPPVIATAAGPAVALLIFGTPTAARPWKSAGGTAKARLEIHPRGERHLRYWHVVLETPRRRQVEPMDCMAKFNAYFGWGSGDRLWFYCSDNGFIHYFDPSPEGWRSNRWNREESELWPPDEALPEYSRLRNGSHEPPAEGH